ncbi:MAG: mobile mystery protein B [Bacteroidetes bacterium]|jgi:Fic-DOC domain mobile mystery protein B|uniref:mobile mystery protein B n=1 Tax=Phnomibacter sp. TaxID=2836217 RepID=UPI002FDE86B5|nr:mobile mystery protein B [Bacteroidota bacterium]MCC6762839.1 mobile mystery protein B [Chitinophagaceae bacterium]
MGLILDYEDGQTPLDEDEKEGLLIPTIATRAELDEFEQQNIEHAIQWTFGRRLRVDTILSEDFIKAMHKRMFGEVWAWAGEFRHSNKNIGVDKWLIATELKNLLDDAGYWIQNNTYPPDEWAIRFKHRLVSIHCFSNGNGRHSRLMADVLIEKVAGLPVFTWGRSYPATTAARTAYLQAMKSADLHDIQPLLIFARA